MVTYSGTCCSGIGLGDAERGLGRHCKYECHRESDAISTFSDPAILPGKNVARDFDFGWMTEID